MHLPKKEFYSRIPSAIQTELSLQLPLFLHRIIYQSMGFYLTGVHKGIFSKNTLMDDLNKNGVDTASIVSFKELTYREAPWSDSFDRFYDINPKFEGLERHAEETNELVSQFLDHTGKNNFFLFLHYFDPHTTYNPPTEKYKTMYTGELEKLDTTESILQTNAFLKKYYSFIQSWKDWLGPVNDIKYPETQYRGEISYVDEQFGALIEKIKMKGIYDNTVIIFTSDHGEEFGEHNIWFCHEGLWNPCIEVPLIIKLPKNIQSISESEALVSNLDIYPTILDLLNITSENSTNLRGKSLKKVMTGEQPEAHRNLYIESVQLTDRGIVDKDWIYLEESPEKPKDENNKEKEGGDNYAWLHGLYNYSTWLSNLHEDPYAQVNLADQDEKTVKKYKEILKGVEIKEDLSVRPTVEISEEKMKRLKNLGYIQ